MMQFPIIFNCFFRDERLEENVSTYKIEQSDDEKHPYHLFKLENIVIDRWAGPSLFTSVDACIIVVLSELFTPNVTEAIEHGRSSLNVAPIVAEITSGSSSITISSKTDESRWQLYDIFIEDLITADDKG
jgi:hypothetical protein